jgi:hypothetical protein
MLCKDTKHFMANVNLVKSTSQILFSPSSTSLYTASLSLSISWILMNEGKELGGKHSQIVTKRDGWLVLVDLNHKVNFRV